MVRYHIRINTGDANVTDVYHFTHKSWNTITREESDKEFDKAVKELNRIYKSYGRFATKTGVLRLFEAFGFELSPP